MDSEEEAVKQTCFDFMKSYSEGNVEKTLETLSESTPVIIGTAKHEVDIGRQEIRHSMTQVADSIDRGQLD